MVWKETTTMSLRTEYIHEAQLAGANINRLCRRFGISRKTGYKRIFVGWVELVFTETQRLI